MKLFDQGFEGIQRAMDLRFRRHVLLTSNIANSETPGYKARELDFAGQLEKAFGETKAPLAMTDDQHLDLTISERDHVTLDQTGAMGADGNNVDLDIMMGKLSDNGRAYESAVSMMSQKLRMLRTFIRRGAV